MLFKKEFLIEELEPELTKTILEENVGERRWVKVIRRVFEFENKFYETFYERGLTEYQDMTPYEDEPDEIECKEVFKKEKTIIVYE